MSIFDKYLEQITLTSVSSLVDFDQRYSAYPTPTYPSDSVSVAKNSKDVTGKTKSARNFIYTLIRKTNVFRYKASSVL